MKKYTVSIKEGNVYQNGILVARISGPRGEKWVETIIGASAEHPCGTDRKFFARCKYMHAAQRARDLVKWAFGQFSVAEIVAFGESGKAPLEWAEEQGYVPYMIRKNRQKTEPQAQSIFSLQYTRLVCKNSLVTE